MSRFALLVIVFVFGVAVACGGDEDGTEPPRASTGSTPFSTRPAAGPAPSGETPQPPSSGTINARQPLTGLFGEARELELAAHVAVPERPETQFRAWDGASVVLYDTVSGAQYDFGPGKVWAPAFGGSNFVYTGENEVLLVDLTTMQREALGRGLVAYFLGDEHVVVNPGDNAFVAVGVETKVPTPLEELTAPLLRSMAENRWGGSFSAKWLDGRYVIRNLEQPEEVCEESSSDRRRCTAEVSESWVVEDLNTGEVLLAFRANKVEQAGPGEIVIATSPLCEDGDVISCYSVLSRMDAQNPNSPPNTFVQGWTNIFLANVETGATEFVATASYNAGAGRWPMSWPLAADENYVAWTESFCGEPRGTTRILVRATGEIIELDQSHWVTLSDGKLGLGEFGAKALLDLTTFEYTAVLPDLADVSWSSDFRYAAVGQAFGHPGICE